MSTREEGPPGRARCNRAGPAHKIANEATFETAVIAGVKSSATAIRPRVDAAQIAGDRAQLDPHGRPALVEQSETRAGDRHRFRYWHAKTG